MGRKALIAVLAVLLAVTTADAAGRKAFKSSGFTSAAGINRELISHAPLDSPSDPLNTYLGTGTLTLDRDHDVSHSATYLSQDNGFISVATADTLRIESAGALIEGPTTNLTHFSEQFDHVEWSKIDVSVSPDNILSPAGTLTADRMTVVTTGDGPTLNVSQAGDLVFSASWFVKAGTTADFRIREENYVGTVAAFNLATGVVVSGPGRIQAYPNGWYRCSIYFTYAAGQTNAQFKGKVYGDVGQYLYLWGAQFEVGGFPTSYLQTIGGTVSRNGDDLTVPSPASDFGVSAATGSAYAELTPLPGAEGSLGVILGSGASFVLANWGGDAAFYDGATLPTDGDIVANTTSRIGTRWSGSEAGIIVNGGTITTGNFNGTLNLNSWRIGSNAASTWFAYGHIKNVKLWNRALSDAELKAITQ